MRIISSFVFHVILCWDFMGLSAIDLDISPQNPIVLPGHDLTMLCKADYSVSLCRFEVPGFSHALLLSPTTKPNEEYKYFGKGPENGECGIHLFNISEANNGNMICEFLRSDDADIHNLTTYITVAKAPNSPVLNVAHGNYSTINPYVYREGDVLRALCVVENGRPQANIRWYIGNNVITEGIKKEIMINTPWINTRSNISHQLTWKENGCKLRCVSDHIALVDHRQETAVQLNVTYAPRFLKSEPILYGYVLGKACNITVVIQANPKPQITRMIGKDELSSSDVTGLDWRIVEEPSFDGIPKWTSIIYFDNLTTKDVEMNYSLKANNSVGVKIYSFTISTLQKSPASSHHVESEDTSMIAASISILATILICFIIGLTLHARKTERLCFKAQDSSKMYLKENSDTESVGYQTVEKVNKSPKVTFSKGKNKVHLELKVEENVKDDERGNNVNLEKETEIMYAELNLQSTPKPNVIGEEDMTVYAQIVHKKLTPSNSQI